MLVLLLAWSALAQDEPSRSLVTHDGAVLTVAASPDGALVASTGADGKISLCDPAGAKPIAVLSGHGKQVSQVAFRRDGKRLASVSHDGTLRVWDVAKRKEIRTLEGHDLHVRALAFAAGGRLVSGSDDKSVRVWPAKEPDPALRAGLVHEGFHQYFRSIIGEPPDWINEGLAELLENADIGPDGAVTPRNHRPWICCWREAIRGLEGDAPTCAYTPLRDLVRAPKEEWLRSPNASYCESWGLVSFLWEDPRLREVLKALKPAASRAENLEAAFRGAGRRALAEDGRRPFAARTDPREAREEGGRAGKPGPRCRARSEAREGGGASAAAAAGLTVTRSSRTHPPACRFHRRASRPRRGR